jgi:hypothetical protein
VKKNETPKAKSVNDKLLTLPVALCFYANFIEFCTKQIPALNQHVYPRIPFVHSRYAGSVSTLALVITGRFCDTAVSEILNAPDLVLNPGNPKAGLRFNPQRIADLRSRRKKQVPQTWHLPSEKSSAYAMYTLALLQ